MTEGYNIAARRSCRKACHGLPRVNASGTLLEGIARWGELKPLQGRHDTCPTRHPRPPATDCQGRPPTVDRTLRRWRVRRGSGR